MHFFQRWLEHAASVYAFPPGIGGVALRTLIDQASSSAEGSRILILFAYKNEQLCTQSSPPAFIRPSERAQSSPPASRVNKTTQINQLGPNRS